MQHRGVLTNKWATTEARLADLLHCELVLEAGHATVIGWVERHLPTFTRTSQNVAMVATLLDALLAPSTDGVGEMY
jgi:hypothetical protein